jgi:hypothetical protein
MILIKIIFFMMHHFEGTHEFQWLSFASYRYLGIYNISGYFIDGSEAIGVLTVAYQSSVVNGEIDISYILTTRSLGKKSLTFPLGQMSNNSNHVIEISVFTVEKDGLPFNRSVSSPKSVSATILKDNGNTSIYYYY